MGLRRRGNADPFSDEARFPSLVQDQQNSLRQTFGDIQQAGIEHTAAVAGGPNSIAARFDPMNSGSIFSRQYAGAFDAAHDQLLREDPSNNYYNGSLPRRAGNGAAFQIGSSLSAMDRDAINSGYQTPAQIAQQQGMSATDRYAADTGYSPTPSLRKRIAAVPYDGT
jgi:hypothetical protein